MNSYMNQSWIHYFMLKWKKYFLNNSSGIHDEFTMNSWIHEFMISCMKKNNSCMKSWIHEFIMNSLWIHHEFIISWKHEIMNSWIHHEFMNSWWIHDEFMNSCMFQRNCGLLNLYIYIYLYSIYILNKVIILFVKIQ